MKKKIVLTIVLLAGVYSLMHAQIYEDISVQEAHTLIADLQNNEAFTLIDVRTPGEYDPEHLENAYLRNIYDVDFEQQLDSLNKNRIYLIYCRSGNRSANAFNMMQNLDFQEVYNMLGGITSWKSVGYPVTDALPPEVDLTSAVISSSPQVVTNQTAISIYPNPFNNKLIVDGDLTDYNIIIYNQNEQIVEDLTGLRNPLEIDLNSLPAGLFYLAVQSQNNQFVRFRNIIKQ